MTKLEAMRAQLATISTKSATTGGSFKEDVAVALGNACSFIETTAKATPKATASFMDAFNDSRKYHNAVRNGLI